MAENLAYPLSWPAGWPRKPAGRRRRGTFKASLAEALRDLGRELRMLGATSLVVSTDLKVRKADGMPYSGQPEPNDPGAAIYFQRDGKRQVIACDSYTTIAANVRAISLTVGSLRAIHRHGASELLDRAFLGFNALTAPPADPPWHEVLEVDPDDCTDADTVEAAYRRLVMERHPDRGGSVDDMARLNRAYDRAKEALGPTVT